MNKPFIISSRIALAYISEKIAEASEEANQADGMEADSFECFSGWFLEYYDFKEWAECKGYDAQYFQSAWDHIGRLLGIRESR